MPGPAPGVVKARADYVEGRSEYGQPARYLGLDLLQISQIGLTFGHRRLVGDHRQPEPCGTQKAQSDGRPCYQGDVGRPERGFARTIPAASNQQIDHAVTVEQDRPAGGTGTGTGDQAGACFSIFHCPPRAVTPEGSRKSPFSTSKRTISWRAS